MNVQTLSNPIGKSNNLHSSLVEIIRQYEQGGITYIQARQNGEVCLARVEKHSKVEKDAISLEFKEAINQMDRRREELQEGAKRDELEPRDKAEFNQLDWGEVGEFVGGRQGRRGGGIKEDKCLWYKSEEEGERISESQRKTSKIIQYLREDYQTAVQWTKLAPGSP
jgi:hypothetical protein